MIDKCVSINVHIYIMHKKTARISLLICHTLFSFNHEEDSMQTTTIIDSLCQLSGMKEALKNPH